MLEQLIYKNHLNEVFEFGKDGIFVNAADLHSYKWSVNAKGNKIKSMEYGVQTRSLPVIIVCENEADGIAARNRLFEVCEKDVLALEQGQIILGGYAFKCFVTKSEKKDYLISDRYIVDNLTLTSDRPVWTKETQYSFAPVASESAFLDFNGLDFPYDYFNPYLSLNLPNPHFAEANFRLIIYGACSNPSISIGGHTYQVNCTVEANQYLTIDSVTKKIFITKNDGSTVNVFNSRNREHYIFQKIPVGSNVVAWNNQFHFDVILLEERSEPKWI